MAKCPVCNARKGKRKCAVAHDEFVCSLCCGNTPKGELCLDCVYYQIPHRNYDAVPAFSDVVMANNHALQNYSCMIETAFCDADPNKHLEYQDTIAIIELLMDKYYFKDSEAKMGNLVSLSGFESADNVIKSDLNQLDEETLINLLGAIRYSIKIRTENLQEFPA